MNPWADGLLALTEFADAGMQFDLAETHTDLCARGVEYIYVGGVPQSFDAGQLYAMPIWYDPSFALPSAKIYQVLGCKG